MAVTNRILWLINIVLLLPSIFLSEDVCNKLNHGAQECEQGYDYTFYTTAADSPTTAESPKTVDSPTTITSSTTTDSPTTVDSPKTVDSTSNFAANPDSTDQFVEFNDKDMQKHLSFQNLPDSYKTLFMSVEDLNNFTDTFVASEAGKNSRLVYNRMTNEIMEKHLEQIVSQIELTLIPGTFTKFVYTDGCCPSIGYAAPVKTLTNIFGENKNIVNFPDDKPPMYQYIYQATCCSEKYGSSAYCHLGQIPTSLLVYNTTNNLTNNFPYAFDRFYISSYCRCDQH